MIITFQLHLQIVELKNSNKRVSLKLLILDRTEVHTSNSQWPIINQFIYHHKYKFYCLIFKYFIKYDKFNFMVILFFN